jgi:hypothetical protein
MWWSSSIVAAATVTESAVLVVVFWIELPLVISVFSGLHNFIMS